MRKFFTSLCVLVVAFATTNAQAVSLGDLIGGQTITVDDKLFDNWVLLGKTDPEFAPPIDLGQIEVTGLDNDPLNPGLHFEANGSLFVDGGLLGNFLDLNFGFDVTVLDPNMRIKDNSLEITGFSSDFFSSLILIEETVSDATGTEIAFKEAFVDDLFDDIQLFDSAEFDPVARISVEKNILVFADFDGFAELVSFEQHFSQVEVPEPATLALLSLGLIGFGIGRRHGKA